MATSSRTGRLTQEQRTAATRARLLEATLDLIAEKGWAETTTQKICERAGVSRGAQTHHFPTKDNLLIAAVTEIVGRYQKDLDTAAADPAGQVRRLEDVFEFLWTACFEGNLLTCWMEVMVAARTDQVLGSMVRVTDAKAIDAMRAMGEMCQVQAAPPGASASDIIELTVYLLRGMVVQSGIDPDQQLRQRLFNVWKSVVTGRLT
ncbi:MAG: TetR/AcrR family transcriptional regulator [Hyphomonadaceae bacterium]|nr:TetR/AcrR family transcriptional regulator [Hyphomonadaceae bacterium]